MTRTARTNSDLFQASFGRLGERQRNCKSTRRFLAGGIEEVKLTRLGRDPNLVGASLEIGACLFGDLYFRVRRRDNFHANLRRAGEYFGACMALHKSLRRPDYIRHAQSDIGQHRALRQHNAIRKLFYQFAGNIGLKPRMLYARRAHFDFPPRVEFNLVWQVAKSRITQNFLPFQCQRFGRCDVSNARQI